MPQKKICAVELVEAGPYQWENEPRRRGKKSGRIRIYASSELLEKARQDGCINQVMNVAQLPGLVGPSMAMPDIHTGYGFCIGGVAAFAEEDGIVSPGGVGYDINCGVRLMATSLQRSDLAEGELRSLGKALLSGIPSGLNRGSNHPLLPEEMLEVLRQGAPFILKRFDTAPETLEHIERRGCLPVEDLDSVSEQALFRGRNQLGTLGAGNHFLEIQTLAEILDKKRAEALKLRQGCITIMLHTGSRGLGHQVASDYIALFQRHRKHSDPPLPDPQLVYAQLSSSQARRYLDAHNAAANFAWANRQTLMHDIITLFIEALRISENDLSARLVTDHSHNLASWETHDSHCPGRLLIHRKGATRALPPGHSSLPPLFRAIGQPVLLPGSMGTSSYLLCGTEDSDHSWHSCPHGAGRTLSRRAAVAYDSREKAVEQLEKRDILLFSHNRSGLAEEIPQAYKPVDWVLKATTGAGLARPVARFEPLLVLKG